jgi:hypothetical protein
MSAFPPQMVCEHCPAAALAMEGGREMRQIDVGHLQGRLRGMGAFGPEA